MNVSEVNRRTGQVIDAAMKIHTALGPGLLESAYHSCLVYELRKRGLFVLSQVLLPIMYDAVRIETAYRIDLLVEDTIVVELKAIAKLLPVHQAQLLSYLRLSGYKVGLLINFHELHLRDGIRRMVNDL
jgi:GxxExxY protein